MINRRKFLESSAAAVAAATVPRVSRALEDSGDQTWTIYITNDNCPDYTWGNDEAQTRRNFAEIVRSHLDEMNRTDDEQTENRDRYNMAVVQEALLFLDRYPEREAELVRRIKEGRVCVSPFLCNSLWAFHGVEGMIRTLHHARRLERRLGIPIDVAEHIEEPSLPWGVASILAGCGIRWLSVPYYKYDSTFAKLDNPPVFILEGPDGSQLRVVMDPWACGKWSYIQGARGVLADPALVETEWLPHFRGLGDSYPLRAILASGTHSDLYAKSAAQTPAFAGKIIEFNRRPGDHAKLVNAILPDYCLAVDDAHRKNAFLQTWRGCFGHSWDVWPVCMAEFAARMRAGERTILSVESLLSVLAEGRPEPVEATRADRERAEWLWAMLSDHAWNGSNDDNRLVNAELRNRWSEELRQLGRSLLDRAWAAAELTGDEQDLCLFNGLSTPRTELVRIDPSPAKTAVSDLQTQIVNEDAGQSLYFVSPQVPGLGFGSVRLNSNYESAPQAETLKAEETGLEGPYYRLEVDRATGGIGSLIHKATGSQLVVPQAGRTLCQTVYFDGQEHQLSDVKTDVVAVGPVLARLRIVGGIGDIRVENLVTIYAELDRVDLDLRIHKPVTTDKQRLCQVFPVMGDGAELRVETTAAVIRPFPQPKGDLLPGADTTRFAVQGFVDASQPDGPGVTVAPVDAFVLRNDLDPVTFEALGNDQNYRESIKDQHGVTDFRFRYAVRGHAGGYDFADALAWSRSVSYPLLTARGLPPRPQNAVSVDPSRALATCLKPADDADEGGVILRLWETAGRSEPLEIGVRGYRRAVRTDLLERDQEELQISNDKVFLPIRAHGFAALRLLS